MPEKNKLTEIHAPLIVDCSDCQGDGFVMAQKPEWREYTRRFNELWDAGDQAAAMALEEPQTSEEEKCTTCNGNGKVQIVA